MNEHASESVVAPFPVYLSGEPSGNGKRAALDLVSLQRKIHLRGARITRDDGEFLADAKKRNMDIEPTTGEELERIAKEVTEQPAEVIERMKKLLGEKF